MFGGHTPKFGTQIGEERDLLVVGRSEGDVPAFAGDRRAARSLRETGKRRRGLCPRQ